MTVPSQLDDPQAQLYVKAFLETPDSALSKADLFALLWRTRWLALLGSILGLMGGLIAASLMKPAYRSQLVLEYVDRSSAGPDAAIGGALGGIASLAGINVGGASGRPYALGRLMSQQLVDDYLKRSNAKQILFASRWDAQRKVFRKGEDGTIPSDFQAVALFKKKVLSVDDDTITRLITVQTDWHEPSQAARWGNEYVAFVDQVLRAEKLTETDKSLAFLRKELESAQLPEIRGAVAKLIQDQLRQQVVARGTSAYAFRIVDPAVAAEKPFKPQRLLLAVALGLAGMMAGLLVGLLRQMR